MSKINNLTLQFSTRNFYKITQSVIGLYDMWIDK